MSQRKIAESINVRINVGNYQHIEIVKYAEEMIEYSSVEERIVKENALRDDLVLSLQRSMSEIPARLGKGVAEAQIVEESIKTKLPEWLANGAVPNIAAPNLNIANMAVKKEIQVAAEQRNAVDKDLLLNKEIYDEGANDVKVAPVKPVIKPTEIITAKTTVASTSNPSTPVKPLVSVQPELPVQPVVQPVVKKDVVKSTNSDDLFDDEEVVSQKIVPVAQAPVAKPAPAPAPAPTPVKAPVQAPVLNKAAAGKTAGESFSFDDDDFLN